MIFGNIETIDLNFLNERIIYCINYFKEHNLLSYNVGKYSTDRDDIIFRIDEYETQISEERFWQSHIKHIDVYILLAGQERIDVNIYGGKGYHQDKLDDILMLEEMPFTNENLLKKYGDILICMPKEAHKTGIHVELKNKFKIALFKIAV